MFVTSVSRRSRHIGHVGSSREGWGNSEGERADEVDKVGGGADEGEGEAVVVVVVVGKREIGG